ncbi:MAG: hypothetical protein AB9888_00070 [Bacteroidales bacterium]
MDYLNKGKLGRGRKKMKKNHQSYFIVCVFLLMLSFLTSCSVKKTFYQNGSGLDYLRFPLLEPYYAIKIDGGNGWVISLHAKQSARNFWYYLDIQDVTKIAVENGMIFVYSTYSKPIEIVAGGQKKELHWFILIPGQTETGFETEEEFNLGLWQYGINTLQWQDPLSILKEYDQTGCLDWIPDCK